MRTLKCIYVFFLMVAVLPFVSCNDTDDGSFVAPITIYEKINGNWAVTSLKQIDEVAKANAQTPAEMTLTDQFGFSTFTINLNVDTNNEPTNYLIGGTAPKFFPTEGYWSLEYPFQNTNGSASIINLYSDAAKTTQVARLSITAIPGTNKVLELKFSRKAKGITFVSYVYTLSPALQ